MNVVVDGGPARVHPDRVVLRGPELFYLLGKTVIQADGHFGGRNSIVPSVICRAPTAMERYGPGHTRPPEFSDMLPRWEEDSDYKSGTMHLCVLVIAAALCSCFYNVSISSHPTASSAFLPHFEPEFASL